MKLYLVRHGEKEGHGFDAPLTDTGIRQIELLAKKINKDSIKKIYSSANPRSYDSAKIISSILNMPIVKLDRLKEFQRETFFIEQSEIDTDERECIEFLKSFLFEIESIGEDVLLVMNAGVNRMIMCFLLDIPLNRAVVFTQNFASITELELKAIYDKKIWCLNSINKTDHLEGAWD